MTKSINLQEAFDTIRDNSKNIIEKKRPTDKKFKNVQTKYSFDKLHDGNYTITHLKSDFCVEVKILNQLLKHINIVSSSIKMISQKPYYAIKNYAHNTKEITIIANNKTHIFKKQNLIDIVNEMIQVANKNGLK